MRHWLKFIFKAIALISIHTEENLENLTFGHNCEIVDYQPRPGADINGDEEYERLFSYFKISNWYDSSYCVKV